MPVLPCKGEQVLKRLCTFKILYSIKVAKMVYTSVTILAGHILKFCTESSVKLFMFIVKADIPASDRCLLNVVCCQSGISRGSGPEGLGILSRLPGFIIAANGPQGVWFSEFRVVKK